MTREQHLTLRVRTLALILILTFCTSAAFSVLQLTSQLYRRPLVPATAREFQGHYIQNGNPRLVSIPENSPTLPHPT